MYWEGSGKIYTFFKTIFCKSRYFYNPSWF